MVEERRVVVVDEALLAHSLRCLSRAPEWRRLREGRLGREGSLGIIRTQDEVALTQRVTEHLHDALEARALISGFRVYSIIHGNVYHRLWVGACVATRRRLLALLLLRGFFLLLKLPGAGAARLEG